MQKRGAGAAKEKVPAASWLPYGKANLLLGLFSLGQSFISTLVLVQPPCNFIFAPMAPVLNFQAATTFSYYFASLLLLVSFSFLLRGLPSLGAPAWLQLARHMPAKRPGGLKPLLTALCPFKAVFSSSVLSVSLLPHTLPSKDKTVTAAALTQCRMAGINRLLSTVTHHPWLRRVSQVQRCLLQGWISFPIDLWHSRGI